jgi:hypothetical protein
MGSIVVIGFFEPCALRSSASAVKTHVKRYTLIVASCDFATTLIFSSSNVLLITRAGAFFIFSWW